MKKPRIGKGKKRLEMSNGVNIFPEEIELLKDIVGEPTYAKYAKFKQDYFFIYAIFPLLREALEEAFPILDEREEKILRMKFGFDSEGYPRTLEEMGNCFQLTRERIRQIEAQAIRKVRQYFKHHKINMELLAQQVLKRHFGRG
jgi:hypothetical protein